MAEKDRSRGDSDWTPEQRASLKSALRLLVVIVIAVFITALIMSFISVQVGG